MDEEIQFGDLEEAAPRQQLRPDQDRHYAVVAYGSPGPDDLPIFVDVDVLRDMESHALSNTESELGGVLLGGHYEDDEGRPFVVITDSLRAEHYEATKGSFKFTHDTWSDITRKRDEYPTDTQMVGWYHTHPGWGVFLSGMDTYICQHFFAKPLDVALVIDPCQGDRAFFQWITAGGARQTRATGGFYMTASRFRLPELEIFKAQLEGPLAMPTDPRYSAMPGAYPPPVVHIAESRQTWLSIAVLGMLLMQFSVLALIAWRMLATPDAAAVAGVDPREAQLQAQRELLDDIVGELNVAPDGVVQSLEDERRENEKLETVQLGLSTRIDELTRTNEKMDRNAKLMFKQVKELRSANDELREKGKRDRSDIRELKQRLKDYEDPDEDSRFWAWVKAWKWYLSGGLLVILVIVAGLFALYGPPLEGDPLPAEEPIGEPEEDGGARRE